MQPHIYESGSDIEQIFAAPALIFDNLLYLPGVFGP